MPGEIEKLLYQYQQRYPMYKTEVIVDIMLDDGVITFDIADRIKSGESLFRIDNNFGVKKDNSNPTEIFGGFFTPKQQEEKPETNFNRNIEPTYQSNVQGDCWLLSDINSLSYKEWGRDVINEAIEPDSDGGVTIKFKGSPLKEKEIHITAEEIDTARKSGNYSSGDDDMIALELATEKTLRKMVRLGLAKRVQSDKELKAGGLNYRSYINIGVATDGYIQFPVSKLLGIDVSHVEFAYINTLPSADNIKNKIFKWLAENQNDVCANCSFKNESKNLYNNDSKDYIHAGHCYAIKKVVYGKEVIITNPGYSDYEIKIPWKDFLNLVEQTYFPCKDSKIMESFQKLLPENYENDVKKFNDESDAFQALLVRPGETEEERKQEELNKALQIIAQVMRKHKNTGYLRSVIDKDSIMPIIKKIPNLVAWVCNNKYEDEQEYINTIYDVIFALAHKAQEVNVDASAIDNFLSKCEKNVYGVFSSKKRVQKEINKMVNLIKEKE